MFCAQRTVNFNVEGAVRYKTFKNFSSRNRLKLKIEESESPLNFLYGTTIHKLINGHDVNKQKKTFAKSV